MALRFGNQNGGLPSGLMFAAQDAFSTGSIITGTGALVQQDFSASGDGVRGVQALGTPPEFGAQDSSVVGTGSRGVSGSGALQQQNATVVGINNLRQGTGVLQAQSSQIVGSGFLGFSGSGALQQQSAAVVGAAARRVTGLGVLSSAAAVVAGKDDLVTGTGVIAAQSAQISGSGTVVATITAVGNLQAQNATVVAGGGRVVLGSGAAVSQNASTNSFGEVTGPLDVSWEGDDETWGGVDLTAKDFMPIFINGSDFFILGQNANLGKACFVERKAVVEGQGVALLGSAVWPQILGPVGSSVQISLGAHDTPDGAIDWEGPYDFVIGQDEFVDFCVSGKYLAVRIESQEIPVWTLQSFTIEYEIIGKY